MIELPFLAAGHPGRGALLGMFVAMLTTFLATRLITRRIRSGRSKLRNWDVGGIHVHHQVFGVIALLVSGCLEFAYQPPPPWADVLGAGFGAGVSLTLDEFALWLHLDDVYWTPAGRKSIDAVFVAVVITGLLLIGVVPYSIVGAVNEGAAVLAATLVCNLLISAVTILKGKPVLGIVGLLVPTLALIGSIRLAKPASPWARWRYGEDSRRLARSRARYGPRYEARWNRVRDLIGGMPSTVER